MKSIYKLVPALMLTAELSAGCNGSTPDLPKPETEAGILTKVTDLGSINLRGENLRNEGADAAVYNPANLRDVGRIATGEVFIASCFDEKPRSIRVVTSEGVEGKVNTSLQLTVLDKNGTPAPQTNTPEIPPCSDVPVAP